MFNIMLDVAIESTFIRLLEFLLSIDRIINVHDLYAVRQSLCISL